MTNVVQTENASSEVKAVPPAGKNLLSTFDKIVLGVVTLGVAATVAYSLLFCATCYGGGGRIVG